MSLSDDIIFGVIPYEPDMDCAGIRRSNAKERIQNAQKRLEKFVYNLYKYPLEEKPFTGKVDRAIQVTLIEIKKIFKEEFGDKLTSLTENKNGGVK